MAEITLVQAVNDALKEEMRRDDNVVILGEDVGINGGVFRCTADLAKEFGEARVIDTPLSESGIIGAAIGMALYGLKPVPEIQFSDFIWPAFDQITSELAKFRYRSGGQFTHACAMTRRDVVHRREGDEIQPQRQVVAGRFAPVHGDAVPLVDGQQQ